MNIVYFYTENAKAKTLANAESLQKEFGIKFELTSIESDYSYWEKLKEYWMKDDIIFLEQDILFTADMIQSLIDCKHKACTYYHHTSKKYTADSMTIGARIDNPDYEILYKFSLEHYPQFASFTSTGLTKICKEFQMKPIEKFAMANAANNMTGINADNAVISNINECLPDTMIKFHVHGYAEHYFES